MINIDNNQIYRAIDKIKQKIDSRKKEPHFSLEIKQRTDRNPSNLSDDNDVLRKMARLVAYSQNARSDLVANMLETGIFDEIFNGFNVSSVAQINNDKLLHNHWDRIKVIRFPSKIKSIVGCAKSLIEIKLNYGSFRDLLEKANIPVNIRSNNDVENFWNGFTYLKGELNKTKMPFFRQTTSLLHFLLHIGYDCVKPDLIVMRVAKKIGMVSSEKGEKNLIKTVKIIQLYGVEKNMKPSVIDLYLLIYGGQQWARQFIR